MEKFDFSPLSVGQALLRLEELLAQASDPLEISLENQVVKLNILKLLTQKGIEHETHKIQHRYCIRIQNTAKPEAQKPPQLDFPSEKGFWLIIAHDQVGYRDPELGKETLRAALCGVRPHEFIGVFLVHRGVRLLADSDSSLIGLIQKWDRPTYACRDALNFFHIAAPPWIQPAAFSAFSQATSLRDWIWI